MNFTSTDYHNKEELRSKGIKIPSKLLSPKYQSQSSENEAKEEGSVEPSKTAKRQMELMKKLKAKEVEEETEGETKEEEEDDQEHFDTFPTMKELRYQEWPLKNPRPP
ncbi:hypothetical protein Tco_0176300 [Tanacetum coccineum]